MIVKVTRAKPFVNPFRDFKGEIYKRLIDNELVCSRESAQIRKYVYVFIQKGYPIDRMACDCGKYERKHYAYYYEWALDYRTNKEG